MINFAQLGISPPPIVILIGATGAPAVVPVVNLLINGEYNKLMTELITLVVFLLLMNIDHVILLLLAALGSMITLLNSVIVLLFAAMDNNIVSLIGVLVEILPYVQHLLPLKHELVTHPAVNSLIQLKLPNVLTVPVKDGAHNNVTANLELLTLCLVMLVLHLPVVYLIVMVLLFRMSLVVVDLVILLLNHVNGESFLSPTVLETALQS
jgi:hypothetical protein